MSWKICILALFMSGCAMMQPNKNSRFVKEVDWSLSGLRMLVSSQLPVGQRSVSPNGREYVSKYFTPSPNEFKAGDDATDRYYVQYTILGDRRPYDIEILVTHEKRILHGTNFVYREAGNDARLASELAERLRRELTKRREERNVIDDFRVY